MVVIGNINNFILCFLYIYKELYCVRSPPNVQYKIWDNIKSKLDTPFSFNVLTQFNNVYVLILVSQSLQFL